VDPGENGAILDAGGGGGPSPPGGGNNRQLASDSGGGLDVLKMLEGTGEGSAQQQATFMHRVCIICALCVINNHNCEPCFTVPICFRRINHMAVKNHLHSFTLVHQSS
jgi:hypothetical protein